MTDPETQREAIGSDSHEGMHDIDGSSYERPHVMADETVYEPGPSFVENDRPTDRLTDMPAWLQSFAATEQRPAESTDAVPESIPESPDEPTAQAGQVEPDESLPEWLRTEPTHSAPDAATDILGGFDDFQQTSDDGSDPFISEDDLPDWLRAFSHETTGPVTSSPPSVARATAPRAAASGATKVPVPPVESVWLSAYDRQALGPGRTLFALLAANGGAVSDTGTNGASGGQGGYVNSSQDAGYTATPASEVGAVSVSQGSSSDSEAEKPRKSMRLVLIALIVVVLLLFVSVTFL